ncbi:unnamed protein product [Moneuplotes crassus]|uniref:Uncharacterized protein n=1 Tax=Euplotes crassus TaxID=5936 RepID=A0AAD1XD61_EUPCR|nr:unnamed protein product [Moneuplotes crassus]
MKDYSFYSDESSFKIHTSENVSSKPFSLLKEPPKELQPIVDAVIGIRALLDDLEEFIRGEEELGLDMEDKVSKFKLFKKTIDDSCTEVVIKIKACLPFHECNKVLSKVITNLEGDYYFQKISSKMLLNKYMSKELGKVKDLVETIKEKNNKIHELEGKFNLIYDQFYDVDEQNFRQKIFEVKKLFKEEEKLFPYSQENSSFKYTIETEKISFSFEWDFEEHFPVLFEKSKDEICSKSIKLEKHSNLEEQSNKSLINANYYQSENDKLALFSENEQENLTQTLPYIPHLSHLSKESESLNEHKYYLEFSSDEEDLIFNS